MASIPDNQTPNAPKKGSTSSRRSSNTRRMDKRSAEALRVSSSASLLRPTVGERDLSFFDVVSILERQAWIIVLATVAATALACYMFVNQEKRYAARSSVYIPATNSMSLLSGVERGGSVMQNMRGDSIETHALIFKSYQILYQTWKKIVEDPEKRKLMRTVNPNDPKIENGGEHLAVASLVRMISVSVGGSQRDFKDANTITVSCEALDPYEAAMIVNTVVEQYQAYFTEKYNRTNDEVRKAIEDSRTSLKVEIEEKRKDLFEFIKTSQITFIGSEENNPLLTSLIKMSENLVNIDFQLLKLENRLESLETSIAGREIDELKEEEIIALMSGGEGDAVLETLISTARGSADAETYRVASAVTFGENTLQTRITELNMRLVEAQKQYSSDHPQVKSLKQQIADLERQVEDNRAKTESETGKIGVVSYHQLFRSYLEALKRRMSELREEKTKINSYVEAKDEEVRSITEYREMIASKKLSIETLKMMLDQNDQSLKQLSLMSNVNTYQVEVLSQAVEDPNPVYPNFFKFLVMGFAVGLVGGVALAYLVDVTDATFHSPTDVVRMCRAPILVQIRPFIPHFKDITPKTRKMNYEAKKPDPALIAYYHSNDPLCENFRLIRTRVFNQFKGVKSVVLMGTSPHPTDGKTMFISNLAVKFAESGKKVLLIDGDMRKPDLHKWFGLTNTSGFSNVLTNAATIEDSIKPTVVENLSVMTAGTKLKSPSEIVASQRFDEVIANLRQMYDVILIDAPPTLYVNDAQSMGPRVDGVFYIFRIRRRGRPDVVSGIRGLADVGSNILGCVVNLFGKHRSYNEAAIEEDTKGYGYGYGYGSGYGGGYGGGYGEGYEENHSASNQPTNNPPQNGGMNDPHPSIN